MDYESILKGLRTRPTLGRTPLHIVTEEELERKAFAMQRRGYVHNEHTLKALTAYLNGYGILLSGGIGVGKTCFFERVNPEPISFLSFNRCHLWKYDKLEEWLEDHRNEEVVLDDIGYDTEKASNYGLKFEALQVALDYRLTESEARTHITTNMTNDELIARYDPHLVDRIYQLCRCFALPPQESRREAEPNAYYIRNTNYAQSMGKEVL